jgi:hypothetical protein
MAAKILPFSARPTSPTTSPRPDAERIRTPRRSATISTLQKQIGRLERYLPSAAEFIGRITDQILLEAEKEGA